MNICIFDTETVSLEKPFCYNVGYCIYDTDNDEILVKRDFVIEQIWHNNELFHTAYYAEKRLIYVKRMRAKQAIMDKWGYVMGQMLRDFRTYDVKSAYAHNSTFDDKVFTFNCDWFKTKNPFDNIPIYDILGYAHNFICNSAEYMNFCEIHKLFTESGNYSATAENLTKFLTGNTEFQEEHTALADSLIELEILLQCIKNGALLNTEYPLKKSLQRIVEKDMTIKIDGEVQLQFKYLTKTVKKETMCFKTK